MRFDVLIWAYSFCNGNIKDSLRSVTLCLFSVCSDLTNDVADSFYLYVYQCVLGYVLSMCSVMHV